MSSVIYAIILLYIFMVVVTLYKSITITDKSEKEELTTSFWAFLILANIWIAAGLSS